LEQPFYRVLIDRYSTANAFPQQDKLANELPGGTIQGQLPNS
jgi:hypothetical protein